MLKPSTNHIKYLGFIVMAVWYIFFIFAISSPDVNFYIKKSMIPILIIHILIMFVTLKLHQVLSPKDKKIITLLILGGMGLFLNEVFYYITLYFNFESSIFLGYISYFIWSISLIILLFKVVFIDVLKLRPSIFQLVLYILFNLIILYLFLGNAGNQFEWGALNLKFMVLNFTIDLIMFNLIMVCIVYAKDLSMIILLIGLIEIITGDFFSNYTYYSKVLITYKFGKGIWLGGILLWVTGLITLLQGTILIYINHNQYHIAHAFRNKASARIRLTIWSFSFAIASFLVFFILAYLFSIINKTAFIFLPLFTVIYSIVIIIISIFISKKFDTPFKQMRTNVDNLILKENPDLVNKKFDIEEFQYLHNYLEQIFAIKKERDYFKNKISELATKVAHDIRSPVKITKAILNKENIDQINSEQLTLLKRQINNIDIIAKTLLDENKNSKAFLNQQGYQTLYSIIENIIEDKKLEWDYETLEIKFDYNVDVIIWLTPQQSGIATVISNLFNNAYEAAHPTRKLRIALQIKLENNYIFIKLCDNGCGMSEEQLNYILLGNSLKIDGNGIGLKSSIDFLNTINGNLEIKSQLDTGTNVIVKIPIFNIDKKFASNIVINTKKAIIADNRPESICVWQERLYLLDLNYKFVPTGAELILVLEENDASDHNSTFFINYELIADNQKYLEIIKNYRHGLIYIIGDCAEEKVFQEKITSSNIRLLPQAALKIAIKIEAQKTT